MGRPRLPENLLQENILLEYFMKNPHVLIPHDYLMMCLGVDTRQAIYRLVNMLRKKYLIETVEKDGYIYWGELDEEEKVSRCDEHGE